MSTYRDGVIAGMKLALECAESLDRVYTNDPSFGPQSSEAAGAIKGAIDRAIDDVTKRTSPNAFALVPNPIGWQEAGYRSYCERVRPFFDADGVLQMGFKL